jgi:hypothetical protein
MRTHLTALVLSPLPCLTTGELGSAASYGVGASPAVVSVDPSNRYLFAAAGPPNTRSPYSINAATGALTAFLNGTVLSVDNATPVAFYSIP